MIPDDPIQDILREWQAPEPSSALDHRTLAAYRAGYRPSGWRSFWQMRISVPVPALAALAVLLALGFLLEWRLTPKPAAPRIDAGYVTRLDTAGFQPLPNGEARVVQVGSIQQ
jgi:hypothetical protein